MKTTKLINDNKFAIARLTLFLKMQAQKDNR